MQNASNTVPLLENINQLDVLGLTNLPIIWLLFIGIELFFNGINNR